MVYRPVYRYELASFNQLRANGQGREENKEEVQQRHNSISAEWFCWLSYSRSLISRLNYTLNMANMMFVFVEEI